MGQMFNTNVIYNIINIESKMLNSIKKISDMNDLADINYYNSEIEKLKLYYKKELFLLSKIPDDIDFYNYLFELLKKSNFEINDESIVLSRFRNILYNNFLNLKSNSEFVTDIDEDDYYDDELFELKSKLFIRDNLLIEYLKSFDGPMNNCDEKSYVIFNKIRFYNIFLNRNLFDFWIKSNFDFNVINYCSNEEVVDYLDISKEEYYYLLNDTISESCSNLLTCIFSDVRKPKSNIIIQDSFFNFKFLIKKLSTESVKAIKNEMDDVYSSVGKYGLLSDVIESLDYELSKRDDLDKNEDRNISIDPIIFDKIINLVKLEDMIFDLYSKIDFNSSDNDLGKLNELVLFEKDLVKELSVSPNLLFLVNDLLSNNLWIYLTGDSDDKGFVISQRISNLLPFYKDLKISPSQSIDSYNFIYKNHMIRSLNDLWELKSESDDDIIKNGFEKIYKFYYYINPELTDEFLALNGNHNLLFDLTSDLSGLDPVEYQYDQDEQLFNLGCEIISFIFDNEDNINSVLDYSEFQFKINELMDIISNLSNSYNKKLYKYMMECSSLFSPLRHDLRKIFKEELGSFKVKTFNK